MSSIDVVLTSAQAGVDTVNTDLCAKLTQHSVNLVGREVAALVGADERPGVMAPTEILVGGKLQMGAVLVLEGRAILAWITGTFRTKNFEAVIPLSAIRDVQTGERDGAFAMKDRETLTIQADERWDLVFPTMFDGGIPFVAMLAGMLTGAVGPIVAEA